MRTITVQGHGTAKRSPDQIRIDFSVRAWHDGFVNAVAACQERIGLVKAAANAAEVTESQLKTADFKVAAHSEWDQDARAHRNHGFIASHDLSVVLPWEKERVGRLLDAVIGCGAEASTRLTFLVSDVEGMRQTVLAEAITNARRRAETIASAAGLKLGAIHNITHGYVEIRIESEPRDISGVRESVRCASIGDDISPDDLQADDTVTVVWQIEG
jgi:uncharacterized protein